MKLAETRSTGPEEMLQNDSSEENREDSNDIAAPSMVNRECREVVGILGKFSDSGKGNETRLTKALSEFRWHLISCSYCEEIVNALHAQAQARRRSF